MVEGPGALAFLFCLRQVKISSMVISVVHWLYHSGDMFSFGCIVVPRMDNCEGLMGVFSGFIGRSVFGQIF